MLGVCGADTQGAGFSTFRVENRGQIPNLVLYTPVDPRHSKWDEVVKSGPKWLPEIKSLLPQCTRASFFQHEGEVSPEVQ